MAKLRLIGAVGIKVRPDASDFRQETERDIKNQIGPNGERVNTKVKLDVDADTTGVKNKVTRLQDDLNGKQIKLNVTVDYDGVQRAKGQIDQALKSLDNKVLHFEMDRESIAQAKRDLRDLEKNAQVDFKFVRDEAGYQSILNKIKKIREQKGLTSTWHFKTDTQSLADAEKKAKEALKRIEANKTVTLTYSKNYEGIKSAIGDIDRRLEVLRNLKLKTKLDPKSLAETKAKLLQKLEDAPVTVKFSEDRDGYEKVLSRIKEIRNEKVIKTVEFNTDTESLDQWERDFKEKIRALDPRLSMNRLIFNADLSQKGMDEVENKVKNLKEKIESTKANMELGLVGHAPVAAELAFLGRDRVVNYIARVNAASVAAAEGMLKSLGGINILSSAGSTVEKLFTKFDTLSLKASSLAVVLGSLTSAGVGAGAAMFKIGEGVAQSAGLLAAVPALAAAATSSFFVLNAAFDNFVGAFSDDAKKRAQALAELPPQARRVVESFRGLFDGLQRPVQDAFWKEIDGSLQGVIDHTIPTVKAGLLSLAAPMGRVMGGIIDSFNEMAVSGDLKAMFGNLEGFFNNLGKASKPFFDGFNQFGLKGSQLLPRFGNWIADLAVRWDNWATAAAADGRILNWIEQGANSLKNMWQVGGSVTDMFKAVTRAAGIAGADGLAQFNLDMRETADIMLGEPWQSKASAIFDGALRGAEGLKGGFNDLTGALGDSALWLGNVLDLLGDIGGEGMSRLADLLGGQTYQEGITAELEGMKELVSELGPTFKNLGDIIGNMSKVAGAVLRDLAPIFNQVSGLLDTVTEKLAGNLERVAPRIAATVGGIFSAITPLVTGVTDAVNGLLGLIAEVPNSFVVAGVAAAAFFAMRGMASKFFESFRNTETFKTLEGNWVAQQVAAGKTVDKYRMVNGELTKFTVPTERFNVATTMMGNVATSAGNLGTQFRTLNDMARLEGTNTLSTRLMNLGTVAAPIARTAIGGLMSALGGPWGIAIAAASIGIGLFAQGQADAQRQTEALTQAIDKQTGAMGKAGLEEMAKRWTDIGKAGDIWANGFRGAKAANETVEALGFSIADMTVELSKGGPAASELAGKWRTLGDAMKVLENAGHSRRPLEQVKADADNAAAALGITTDMLREHNITGADIQHVAKNLEEEAKKADVARLVFDGLGKATGTTGIHAQQMAQAMQTIGDNSISAAQKIGAINRALDLLKTGGKMSLRDAEVNSEQTFQQALQQAEAMREELALNQHIIRETDGLIDVSSTSGLKLEQNLRSVADGVKIRAQATFDAVKLQTGSTAEASKAALEIVAGGEEQLKAFAKRAGIDVEVIRANWKSFFGEDWQLTAVFSASADRVEAVMATVKGLGVEWNESVYTAFIKANPDPTKISVDEARAWAEKFATDQYVAQLRAMNPEALQQILEATGQAENYKNGNYTAVMKALNSTDPGVQAAWAKLMGVVGGPSGAGWAAALKAYADAQSAATARGVLDDLAKPRTAVMTFKALLDDSAIPAGIKRPTQADGAIYNGSGRSPRGFGPTGFANIKAFADGGIHGLKFEKPGPAKIYNGSDTWRVFAEKSTGGEAFIPLAESKRVRSTAILNEVANQFGYTLQKATKFADGGIVSGGNSNSTGLAINIDTYNQNANDTAEDVGRAIMRKVRTSSLTLEGF